MIAAADPQATGAIMFAVAAMVIVVLGLADHVRYELRERRRRLDATAARDVQRAERAVWSDLADNGRAVR